MKSEQKEHVQWVINREFQELQQLEAGQYPAWRKWPDHQLPDAPSLDELRMYADWCLHAVLRAITPTLPEDLRKAAQACFGMREQIWSTEYGDAYYQANKKASPKSLATADQPLASETV